MAVLADTDRATLWARIMSDISAVGESIEISKVDMRIALNAIDQWVDENMVSLNSAIPQPARSNLTANQKLRLLKMVVQRRWEVDNG